MKKLVLFLLLSFLTSGAAYTFATSRGDDPQFKIVLTGSDKAGFDVDYSWPGEGKDPIECTVTVRVKYSANGDRGGGSEEFKMTHKIHNTGNGWQYFDGKSALDKSELLDASITNSSCS
jgi:hypothetical protein